MKYTRKKLEKYLGKAVAVNFWDHAIDINNKSTPIECMCYGILRELGEKYINVTWWDLIGADIDLVKNNKEYTCIMISTIEYIKCLR